MNRDEYEKKMREYKNRMQEMELRQVVDGLLPVSVENRGSWRLDDLNTKAAESIFSSDARELKFDANDAEVHLKLLDALGISELRDEGQTIQLSLRLSNYEYTTWISLRISDFVFFVKKYVDQFYVTCFMLEAWGQVFVIGSDEDCIYLRKKR